MHHYCRIILKDEICRKLLKTINPTSSRSHGVCHNSLNLIVTKIIKLHCYLLLFVFYNFYCINASLLMNEEGTVISICTYAYSTQLTMCCPIHKFNKHMKTAWWWLIQEHWNLHWTIIFFNSVWWIIEAHTDCYKISSNTYKHIFRYYSYIHQLLCIIYIAKNIQRKIFADKAYSLLI